MSEIEKSTPVFDDFDDVIIDASQPNRRICVRYIRHDIKATIRENKLFSFKGDIPVSLIDIGSKGALIETGKKLGIKKKITLSLYFNSGKFYKIKARTVYVLKIAGVYRYGVVFERYHNELGDALFETQVKLLLK
jgi:hypothetical protein